MFQNNKPTQATTNAHRLLSYYGIFVKQEVQEMLNTKLLLANCKKTALFWFKGSTGPFLTRTLKNDMFGRSVHIFLSIKIVTLQSQKTPCF